MDELTFVRELGGDAGRPTAAALAAARARLVAEIEREERSAPVALAPRRAPSSGRGRRDLAPVTPLEPREPREPRGRRIGAIVLAAAATVGVAGVAVWGVSLLKGLAPDDRIAGPTPTPTGTSAPAPSPTLTADPADLSTWEITEEGMGPFALGMPWADAVALVAQVGGDTSAAGDGAACGVVWVNEGDVQVAMHSSDGREVTAVKTEYVGPGGPATPAPATGDGLTLHSTIDQVRAAFPGATETPGNDLIAPFVTVDEDGSGGRIHLAYATETGGDITTAGDVVSIEVNTLDLMPYERCDGSGAVD